MTDETFQEFLDDTARMLERAAQTWCGESEVTRAEQQAVVELQSHDRRRHHTIRTVYQITAGEAARATPEDLVRAVLHDHAEMVLVESRKAMVDAAPPDGAVRRLGELGRKMVLG